MKIGKIVKGISKGCDNYIACQYDQIIHKDDCHQQILIYLFDI